jgi:hypothetical protein
MFQKRIQHVATGICRKTIKRLLFCVISRILKKRVYGITHLEKRSGRKSLKSDTVVTKNYLSEQEIKSLERTIGAFFDYIERIIEARNTLQWSILPLVY